MRAAFVLTRSSFAAVLLLGMMVLSSVNPRQIQAGGGSAKIARSQAFSQQQPLSTAELVAKLIERHHWQEARIDRLSSVRTYKVENTKGKTLAQEVVIMKYTAPGTETFAITSGRGSWFIRHHVFQRLMKGEERRVKANKDSDSLITPENYTLEIIGKDHIGGFDSTVVRATTKRKETDLFDGKIWIDDNDFAIVKIAGHLAKSPSFWINRVDFVRQYQKVDEYWLLLREEVIASVRIYGKETLIIDYQDYTVNQAIQALLRDGP